MGTIDDWKAARRDYLDDAAAHGRLARQLIVTMIELPAESKLRSLRAEFAAAHAKLAVRALGKANIVAREIRELTVLQEMARFVSPLQSAGYVVRAAAERAADRYEESGEHPEPIASRVAELFRAALPFAELGIDLGSMSCHDGIVSPVDCSRCGPVLRLRRALDHALP